MRRRYGPDRGFDILIPVNFAMALRPMLDAVGLDPRLRVILFTLDESAYAWDFAPLAEGMALPAPRTAVVVTRQLQGIRCYRRRVTETAGFNNIAGFNDDTRALCSIPVRHDVARRTDSVLVAERVVTHRLDEDEAFEIAPLLAHGLARNAYRLEPAR